MNADSQGAVGFMVRPMKLGLEGRAGKIELSQGTKPLEIDK